ncbi:holotricin-2-like [Bacillus rossius redtenbacheri]|uniref:holotricin-2-like n=1 Tax=Bacillus rossius redtenbacheri TaxID=93214 RepID=UPI002FDDE3C9
MQLSVLVLSVGLALCGAVPRYELPGPWPATHQGPFLEREEAAMMPAELLMVSSRHPLSNIHPLKARERPRRSLQPGAPQYPLPGAQPAQRDNDVAVSATRERGVGTVVDAQGRANVWRSDDGNTRVDAHGRWTRVYDGPARGQRSHSAGVVFSHRWR